MGKKRERQVLLIVFYSITYCVPSITALDSCRSSGAVSEMVLEIAKEKEMLLLDARIFLLIEDTLHNIPQIVQFA